MFNKDKNSLNAKSTWHLRIIEINMHNQINWMSIFLNVFLNNLNVTIISQKKLFAIIYHNFISESKKTLNIFITINCNFWFLNI